jgi:hypothetical protein
MHHVFFIGDDSTQRESDCVLLARRFQPVRVFPTWREAIRAGADLPAEDYAVLADNGAEYTCMQTSHLPASLNVTALVAWHPNAGDALPIIAARPDWFKAVNYSPSALCEMAVDDTARAFFLYLGRGSLFESAKLHWTDDPALPFGLRRLIYYADAKKKTMPCFLIRPAAADIGKLLSVIGASDDCSK